MPKRTPPNPALEMIASHPTIGQLQKAAKDCKAISGNAARRPCLAKEDRTRRPFLWGNSRAMMKI
jgi:hypothetical protein